MTVAIREETEGDEEHCGQAEQKRSFVASVQIVGVFLAVGQMTEHVAGHRTFRVNGRWLGRGLYGNAPRGFPTMEAAITPCQAFPRISRIASPLPSGVV
jgi:hypothetical protein